jgi:hypothetical protein
MSCLFHKEQLSVQKGTGRSRPALTLVRYWLGPDELLTAKSPQTTILGIHGVIEAVPVGASSASEPAYALPTTLVEPN